MPKVLILNINLVVRLAQRSTSTQYCTFFPPISIQKLKVPALKFKQGSHPPQSKHMPIKSKRVLSTRLSIGLCSQTEKYKTTIKRSNFGACEKLLSLLPLVTFMNNKQYFSCFCEDMKTVYKTLASLSLSTNTC